MLLLKQKVVVQTLTQLLPLLFCHAHADTKPGHETGPTEKYAHQS